MVTPLKKKKKEINKKGSQVCPDDQWSSPAVLGGSSGLCRFVFSENTKVCVCSAWWVTKQFYTLKAGTKQRQTACLYLHVFRETAAEVNLFQSGLLKQLNVSFLCRCFADGQGLCFNCLCLENVSYMYVDKLNWVCFVTSVRLEGWSICNSELWSLGSFSFCWCWFPPAGTLRTGR